MGALAKFSQDPDEVKRYTVSWEAWLDEGETISSVVFEVTITNGSGALLIVSSDIISAEANAVSFLLSGGAANVTYKVTIRIDTSTGQTKEDCILVAVRNC